MNLTIQDTKAYTLFHDIDFNKFPFSLLRPLKTHLYPITSLFIIETPYARFYLDDMIKVTNVDEYCLDDLRPDDVVLDIGACIGGFALRVHNQCRRVYAIEPVMTNRLKKNTVLNNAWNIDVISWGIGEGYNTIEWAGYNRKVITLPLGVIIRRAGNHVDFLKLDCEGAEYCIKPKELAGIRRIEAEVHKTKEHECYEFLTTLHEANFKYQAEYIFKEELMIVHARRK